VFSKLSFVIALLLPVCARAAEGDFSIRNFSFESGESLEELRIHYRTLGTPVRDNAGVTRNAVLILHGTSGSGAPFLEAKFAGELFGPGQPLDQERYYLIIPDGIGHGKSSKPSDGLRARFPGYRYTDMVKAQHRLLTEHLRVNHLRLVMGTSMGGMHSWMWGEMYPGFMDALMPLASLPVEIAGENRMRRRMIANCIRTDPEWKRGEYTAQPRGLTAALYLLLHMTASPLQWQKEAPSAKEADALLDRLFAERLAKVDANDLLYAMEASADYNPKPDLEKITAPLMAINSADDQVNPPELGIAEREIKRVKTGKFILLPITDDTRGHGTHSLPKIWTRYLVELLSASTPVSGTHE
jgi:homoserine O-acetyltransferase